MSGIFDVGGLYGGSTPLSLPYQLSVDNAYNPLSLNRILLTYSYMTHGVIQTVINQPVEDAFRGGLIFKSDELAPEDLRDLEQYLKQNEVLHAIKAAMCWARLYGGSGVIINTDQDPTTELDEDAINPRTPLKFIDADRWELTLGFVNETEMPCPYNYYGQPIHRSRVLKVLGKPAPSFLRQRLQGWGMSELECMIRSIQLYTKAEDMIFELIDEAKIDVMKIQGYNSSGLTPDGQAKTQQRLETANMNKNYRRMLVMDSEDDWQQKQLTFSGIAELLTQIRVGEAAACKMPMAKIFGLSAAGFNSGEDDIENYNSIIESEVRAKASDVLEVILPLCCRQLFGREVDLSFEFKPLRVLSAEQEENVKAQKFNRYAAQFAQGMLTPQEYADILKQENLCPIDTAVAAGAEPIPPEGQASFEKPQQMVTAKEAAA